MMKMMMMMMAAKGGSRKETATRHGSRDENIVAVRTVVFLND